MFIVYASERIKITIIQGQNSGKFPIKSSSHPLPVELWTALISPATMCEKNSLAIQVSSHET